MGLSRQEYWSGLPFPSPVDHILSELSTVTRPSWVALHGMTHNFIELDKTVVHMIRLVSFLVVFSLSALWWRSIRGLWKLPDGIDWLRGILGLVLMGRAMLSKSLIQFSLFWDSNMLLPISVVHPFLLLNNILIYGDITLYLFNYLLIYIWAVSSLGLLK